MQNIYIMGCGRSGTTLMLALMTRYTDTFCLIGETGEHHWSHFDAIDAPQNIRVIKRASNAYEFVSEIPESIGIIYMIRHPLDVLVSTLRYRGEVKNYYIPPDRWIAETRALQQVLTRQNMQLVQYEQLVTKPDEVQASLADKFDLSSDGLFSRFHESFEANDGIDSTMNGIRPPDPNSIGRWEMPKHRKHIKRVWSLIQPEGEWFCREFGYSTPKFHTTTKQS